MDDHRAQAEKYLLKLIFIHPETAYSLNGCALTDERNKIIWDAMLQLSDVGSSIDPINVTYLLHHQNRLERAGGAAYIAEIVDA